MECENSDPECENSENENSENEMNSDFINSGEVHYSNCVNCSRGKCRRCIVCGQRIYEGRYYMTSIDKLKCLDVKELYYEDPWFNAICLGCENRCEKCNNYICGNCELCESCSESKDFNACEDFNESEDFDENSETGNNSESE